MRTRRRISERKLRAIENRNVATAADVLERLARALGVRRDAIVFADNRPRLVPAQPQAGREEEQSSELVIAPRFDDESLPAVMDEAELLRNATSSRGLVTHFLTKLTPETEGYGRYTQAAGERHVGAAGHPSPHRGSRGARAAPAIARAPCAAQGQRRVGLCDAPLQDDVLPRAEISNERIETIIAFGPPGEYGETTVKVRVDHGRPRAYHPFKLSI